MIRPRATANTNIKLKDFGFEHNDKTVVLEITI